MTDGVLSTCQGSKTHSPEAHHGPSEGATPVSTHHCARRSENAGQQDKQCARSPTSAQQKLQTGDEFR